MVTLEIWRVPSSGLMYKKLTMFVHVEVGDLLAALLVVHDDLYGVQESLEVGTALQLLSILSWAPKTEKLILNTIFFKEFCH